MSKKTFAFVIIIVLIILAGGGYWLYTRSGPTEIAVTGTGTGSGNTAGESGNIFSPLAGSNIPPTRTNGGVSSPTGTNNGTTSQNVGSPTPPIPTLRELSTTPVGGMAASSSATSTIVRWVDRGTGYIYQASSNSTVITELSNTTVPMIYQSFWNRNLTAFIFRSLTDGSDVVTNFYTVLSPVPPAIASAGNASTSPSSLSANTPYQLRGETLPSNTAEIAVNPENTSVFTLMLNGSGAAETGSGYVSQFDGSKRSDIFTTPLTQLNVEWPADTTITLTTKGSSLVPGFLYFVNPKTGTFTEILGNIEGLDTLTSRDASQVLYSASANNSLTLSIYNVKAGTSQELAFNTLPEKCVWSTLNKNDLLCAVPSQIPPASYPEAWYQGTVSLSDSLWVVDVSTGEAHEIADLLSLAGKPIDAENLTLDPKENFLYFINKRDLTLWSVSLN